MRCWRWWWYDDDCGDEDDDDDDLMMSVDEHYDVSDVDGLYFYI